MTDHLRGTDDPHEEGKSIEQRDAEKLSEAVREAKKTSPDAFLTTTEDVDEKS